MAKSRRPYLIRALYDWAVDNGYTPHLQIAADADGVVVPREFVKEGRITLNISPMAVQGLDLHSDPIRFTARFAGRPVEVQVRPGAVLAVFTSENGEGQGFGEVEPAESGDEPGTPGPAAPGSSGRPRPKLRVVK